MELKKSKVEMEDDEVVNKEIKDDQSLKIMKCSSNFEDQSFYNVEDHFDKKEVEEDEVDIVGFKGFNAKDETDVSDCNDTTDEYSSSFSGTGSADENEIDQEVSSNDTSLPLWVRKRKVTEHWKRYIQPIMWRSKWAELKIREFQKQARLYGKELKESRQAKKTELEKLKTEEVGIKGMPSPLSSQTEKNRIMKRKKRKRVEETSDVALYTSNHNLFSYNEDRKSFADISPTDNSRNPEKKDKSSKEEASFSDEAPALEFREGDEYIEQILLKIEAAKVEARNLKDRVDKMVNENPSRFSSVNVPTVNPLGTADAFTSSEQEKPQLVVKNEDVELVIPEEKPVKSASVTSHQDEPKEEEDVLLSEFQAKQREGKAVVPDKKIPKTEQTSVVEEGSSRPVRKRKPRNLEIGKDDTTPKKRKVSKEKPKTNMTIASRFKGANNRKKRRGKRRSGSAGLRRRS